MSTTLTLEGSKTCRTYFDEARRRCAIEDNLPEDGGTQQPGLSQSLRAYKKRAHAL